MTTEDFSVALLRGGKGLPGDPLAAVKKEKKQTVSRFVQSSEERSMAIGGNTSGSTITTGNRNIMGNNNVPQVVKAGGGSMIGGITQIAGMQKYK